MANKSTEVKEKTKVSNWWYAVGFLVGIVTVFVFWWFIWPLVISLFY